MRGRADRPVDAKEETQCGENGVGAAHAEVLLPGAEEAEHLNENGDDAADHHVDDDGFLSDVGKNKQKKRKKESWGIKEEFKGYIEERGEGGGHST